MSSTTTAHDQDHDPVHEDVLTTLGSTGARGARRRRWRLLLSIGVVLVAIAALPLARPRSRQAEAPYRTAEVSRGDLTVTVSATGDLQPTNQVDVGSEVSGLVDAVYVDDNDRVTSGQVLARLDTSRLADQVANAKAALGAAEARVLQAEAGVTEASANLARMRQVAELSGGKVPAQAELETAVATAARTAAELASARAAVEQAEAVLSSDETILAKASIRSPIDGIVLARRVEPGQTVAASFQAPVLFTLAEDLTEMELQVDVDEADVGQVQAGLDATFTVDAYSDRTYPARITRVGYGSQTKEGVVSYKTVLRVDNDDLSLRPGMTATAEIVTVQHAGVLLVPNAALRFAPPAATPTETKRGGLVSSLLPRPPVFVKRATAGASESGAHQVWMLVDGQPVAVPVVVGPSDGSVTEITSGELRAGTKVLTEKLGDMP
jgi:HlyD family secretion protein